MNNFVGAIGGQPGFYKFVYAAGDANHIPKNVANVGPTGQNGVSNVCKSNAVDTFAEITIVPIRAGFLRLKERHIKFQFRQNVSEPRCPDNVLASTEPVPQQQPRLPLDELPGMSDFKKILLENMNSFAFKNLIQKVYKAIESYPS